MMERDIKMMMLLLQIDYGSFGKYFYEEHEDITKLTEQEVRELKKKLGLKVNGHMILTFHLPFLKMT